MNERIKKLWLDKLAVSKQTRECLYDPHENSYCCLGVLTQCYLDEHNLPWGALNLNEIRSDEDVYGMYEALPWVVAEWAELYDKDPALVGVGYLSTRNDQGETFTQIAEHIKKL